MTINGETTGVRTVSSHKRGRALLASTALGATLFIAAPAAAQNVSQTSATGEPISINSTTASSTADDVHAIYVQTDGAIDIVSGTATATGLQASAIMVKGGAGNVAINSATATASGDSAPTVFATTTSGNILINAQNTINSGGSYNFANPAAITGEAVYGISDTGRVEINSGIARTSSQYGTAVGAIGGEVLVTSVEAFGTHVDGGALVAARGLVGDASVVSGAITATSATGGALSVRSENGFASATSETINVGGTNYSGINAVGKMGVTVDSGSITASGFGINAVSAAGQVSVTSDVTNSTGTNTAIIALGATGATVNANSVNTNAATQDGVRATATTGDAAITVGTVTGSAAFQSVRGIANAGAVTINAGSVTNNGSTTAGGITGQGLNGVTINAGTVDSSGWAIRAFTNIGGTLGEGHVSINTTGAITSRNSNAISISGNVASFDVTIGADSVVTGNASATVAAGARGDIVIDNQGTILARGNAEGGIGTTSANGNVTVTSNIVDVEGLTAPGTAFVSGGIAAVSNGGGLVSVTSNDVTVAGQNRHGIYTASDGAITIDSDNVATSASATTAQVAGIYAAGGAGAVTITSDTITTSGIGSSAIYATSSSGDISITAADSRSTALDILSNTIYSDVLVGISQTGNVTIDSGYSESASRAGSVVVGIGNNVSIVSDTAVTSGNQGVALYGESSTGNIDIVSGSIASSGASSGINALASTGAVTIQSGSITGTAPGSVGIFARGAGGVAMTLGSVSTGLYAVGAESAAGDVAITATGAITSATQNGITINHANNAAVTIGADSVVNGGFSGVSATSRDSATIVNAGTVTARGSIANARSSAITVTAPGAISITSNIANMTGPGADPGLDTSTGFRFGQGGITANGGAGAITIDSQSVDVSGEGRFGIFASGSGTIDISSSSLTNAARDSSGIFIVGGAGAVTVDSGTLTTTGQSGSGIVARTTSGAIDITANETHANATGIFGDYTADAVVGISQSGAVTIASNSASSDGYAGSAVAGIGGSVAIDSVTAATTGDFGAALYADATNGNASIISGSVETSGLSTDAVVASAAGGSVTIVSGSVLSTGASSRGIYAAGETGASVDSGDVSTGGRALFAGSTGGDTLINITGDVVSSTAVGVNAQGGNIAVNIGADHSVAGATRAVQLNARTQSTVVNAGTITGGQSGITSETGRLTLTNSGTIRGNGTYDGFDQIPHAGVSMSQADGVINNSGTITGAGVGITTAAYFNPATGLIEPRAINTSVVNSGIIRGDSNDGVRLIGGGSVANSGTIEGLVGVGADGISMFAHGRQDISQQTSIGSVVNASGGAISGNRFGIILTGGGVLENVGTISGNTLAVLIQHQGNVGTATVSNSGTMTGGLTVNTQSNSIVNSGTITSSTGAAIVAAGQASIVNAGTLSGTGGVAVQFSITDDSLTLQNGSAITGVADGGEGFDSAELAGTSATLTAAQTLAEMRNFEELTVSSGYWTASTGVSFFEGVTIAEGATLDVREVAFEGEQGGAIDTDTVVVDGLLVLNLQSDEAALIDGANVTGSGGVRLDGEANFVLTNTVLGYTGLSTVANGSLTLTGTGGLSGNVVTSGDGVFILGDGGTTGDFTGDIVNDGGFVFNRSDDYALLGALSGSGDFTKLGAGTLSFAGPYSFTGTTSILGGSLRFAGQIDPATTIDLQSGTFDISGTPQTIAELSGSSESAINIDDSQLTINQTTNTVFAGDISGDGGLVKEGDGLLNLTGNSTYTGNTVVNRGAVAVNGSIASTVIVNDGGTLKGNGTMGGAVLGAAARAAPGNSIGTLNVAGNVSFAAGSIYEVEVDASGASDRIIATGTATLTGGTVQVLAAPGTYRPFTAYNIIQAGGGVSGQFAAVTSNLAFLTPSLGYTSNAVTLELVRNDIDFAGVASSGNQASTANAIEALGPRNALYLDLAVQDEAGARTAFDTLSGELYASVPSAIINDSRHVGAALRDAGRMAGDGPGVWGQAMGSWGELEGRDGVADLDTDYKGLIGGVNFGRDGLGGGIAAGLAKSEYEAGDRASEAEVDTSFVGAHIAYRQGPLTAQAGGAYSWHDISADRGLAFPGFAETATARYDADTTQLFAEIGYALPGAGAIAVEPFARVEHFRTGTDGFDESGESGALGLEDGKRSVQFGSIGLRAAGSLPVSPTMVLEPKASIALRHGWGDLGGRSTAAFAGGGGFDVLGSRLAKNAAELDVGFALKSQNFRIGASYRGLLSERGKDHGAQLTLGYAF